MWICDGIAASLAQRMGGIWLCPIECEGVALDGVSPALRAGASDFGKTRFLLNIRPKVFSPGKPSASRIPSLLHRVGRIAAHGTSLCRLRLRRRP
ncbi:hypothetical protein D3C80_1858920 [compost metagenome]